jgi:phospholipid/cholesterol/gamma-HCH transport system substrate-binding protein
MPRKQAPRRELRRVELARRGLVAVVLAALVLGLGYLRVSGVIGGDPEVSAQLLNAGGSLRPGSDVKIRGVIVGRVTDIGRGPDGGVRVGLLMHGDQLASVPDNVVARVLPATVFGTSFVELVTHGPASSRSLHAGAVIPADRTQGTLELQRALDDIDRLVKALGPAELASAIGSAALALDGRGERLGETIDELDHYLGRVNPRLPVLRDDVRKLAANVELVDRVAPDLLDATDDGLVTAQTIVVQQAAITALITGGTSLVRSADAFLSANQEKFVRYVDNAARLLDALYDNRRAGISGSIATNIMLGNTLPSTVSHGFVRTDSTTRLDAPAYYTSADRPSYRGDASGRSSGGRLDRAGLSRLFAGADR